MLNFNDFVFEALSKSDTEGEHRWATTQQFQCFSFLPRPDKKALAPHHSLIQSHAAQDWQKKRLATPSEQWWYGRFRRSRAIDEKT